MESNEQNKLIDKVETRLPDTENGLRAVRGAWAGERGEGGRVKKVKE